MISKSSIYSKKENEKGERERVTSLVSFEKERERENETFIPRSTRSNSCWRRLIFFLFFSPTASLGWTKFSFLSHKILTKYHSLFRTQQYNTEDEPPRSSPPRRPLPRRESGKRTARRPGRGRKTDENRLRLDRVRAVLENRRLGRRRRLVTD